jgi:hypothetical protein
LLPAVAAWGLALLLGAGTGCGDDGQDGPNGITGLRLVKASPNWLYWEWDVPSSSRFQASVVYLDGEPVGEVETLSWNPRELGEDYPDRTLRYDGFTATNLEPSTEHTLEVRVRWSDGTTDEAGASHTARTLPVPDRTPVCGNDVTEPGEVCDGLDLDGHACPTRGSFTGGRLACRTDCADYDVAGCVTGAVVAATSCERADVEAALAAAEVGDIVEVPAGACDWTEPLTMDRAVTLRGAGADQTTIRFVGLAEQASGLELAPALDAFSRITGFAFDGSGSPGSVYGITVGHATQFRIDHNRFTDWELSPLATSAAWVHGVIDANTMIDCSRLGRYFGEMDAGWQYPVVLGRANQTYWEDNDYRCSGAVDLGAMISGGQGGRFVLRHNTISCPFDTVTLGEIDAHGNQAPVCGQQDLGLETFVPGTRCPDDDQHRGAVSIEVYGNTIEIGNALGRYFSIRGGTGVIYDNVVTGEPNTMVHFWEEEAYRFAAWGSSYPGWDGIHDYHVWNNTLNGEVRGGSVSAPGYAYFIRQDRDYFERPPDRPGDRHYGYLPFTYPHPLTTIE